MNGYRAFMDKEYDVSIDADNETVTLSFGQWLRLCDNANIQTKKIAIRGEALRYYGIGHNDNGHIALRALDKTRNGWTK